MSHLPPGSIVDDVVLPVEAGKIHEFARATATRDVVHVDAASAHAAGYPDVIAPLTYSVATAHLRDQAGFVARLGLDIRRIVMGGVSWEYRRPLHAGETLRAVRTVESDVWKDSRSGRMRLVGLVTEFTGGDGEVVLLQRETLIERGAAS
jgi:acyl dehydratase